MIIAAYILSIIGIILFPISILIIHYFKNTKLLPTLNKYKAYTSASKKTYIFFFIFGFFSTAISIFGLVLTFLKVDDGTSPIAMSLLSMFFAALCILGVYDLAFDFEAVDNNYVYIFRFGKKRQYKITEIVNIVPDTNGVIFQDRKGKNLFVISTFGRQTKVFLKTLDSIRKNKFEQDGGTIDIETGLTPEETELLEKYGEKYRAKYIKNFSRHLINKILIAFMIYGFVFLSCYLFLLLDLALLTLIFFVIFIITSLVAAFKERQQINKSDLHALGLRYYRSFPEVKGHEKLTRLRMLLYDFVSIMIVVFAVVFMFLPSEIYVDYGSLQTKTGLLTAAETYTNENYQYCIGISLDDEMIMYSSPIREIKYQGDFSFYDDLVADQTITIHYKATDEEQKSSYYDEKIPVYNVYYINVDGVTYYDETDHQAFYSYYKTLCSTYSITMFIVAGALLLVPLIYLPISKKKEKQETVEIFKK